MTTSPRVKLLMPAGKDLPLLWPVSDRATPPTEDLPANRETFGQTFRRGQETLAEPGATGAHKK